MKKIQLAPKLIGLGLVALAAYSFFNRPKKMTFSGSSMIPEAKGSIRLHRDKNKNHTIEIEVSHLVPADQLNPPKEIYVVWMTTQDQETKNIGQLRIFTGFFSKAYIGSLFTVTPSKPSSIFITAEDKGDVESPGEVILSTWYLRGFLYWYSIKNASFTSVETADFG